MDNFSVIKNGYVDRQGREETIRVVNGIGLFATGQDMFKNAKGQLLTKQEQMIANYIQKHVNALGYQVPITTLTTLLKQITDQKYFEIFPADYMPVVAGEGPWSTTLTAFRNFASGDAFETGILNMGGDNARLASTTGAVDSITQNVFNWAKGIGWNIMEMQTAAKAGNWDIVTSKEESRKKNADLGIQRIAFLGMQGFNGINGAPTTCLGLLNQPGVAVDTTTITQNISAMTPAELKTFLSTILNVYRINAARTAWPTHFLMPESDYLGLAAPSSSDFPISATLKLMMDTFITMTGNKNFKILPCAYLDPQNNISNPNGLNSLYNYVLLNYDPKSYRMTLPVPYTTTLANSFDNFNFQNAGYLELTGGMLLRPRELYYLQHS